MHATSFAGPAHSASASYKTGSKADIPAEVTQWLSSCLPSRVSRVRVPSPAPQKQLSLCQRFSRQLRTNNRREGKQGGGFVLGEQSSETHLPFRLRTIPSSRFLSVWREDRAFRSDQMPERQEVYQKGAVRAPPLSRF